MLPNLKVRMGSPLMIEHQAALNFHFQRKRDPSFEPFQRKSTSTESVSRGRRIIFAFLCIRLGSGKWQKEPTLPTHSPPPPQKKRSSYCFFFCKTTPHSSHRIIWCNKHFCQVPWSFLTVDCEISLEAFCDRTSILFQGWLTTLGNWPNS